MKPGAKIAVAIGKALFKPTFWRAVSQNIRARRAGKPKPHDLGKLLREGFDMGRDAYKDIKG